MASYYYAIPITIFVLIAITSCLYRRRMYAIWQQRQLSQPQRVIHVTHQRTGCGVQSYPQHQQVHVNTVSSGIISKRTKYFKLLKHSTRPRPTMTPQKPTHTTASSHLSRLVTELPNNHFIMGSLISNINRKHLCQSRAKLRALRTMHLTKLKLIIKLANSLNDCIWATEEERMF